MFSNPLRKSVNESFPGIVWSENHFSWKSVWRDIKSILLEVEVDFGD